MEHTPSTTPPPNNPSINTTNAFSYHVVFVYHVLLHCTTWNGSRLYLNLCTAHTVMVLCLLDCHKSHSAPWAFTSREERVLDHAGDQNRMGSIKVEKRTLILANSMLDTTLSVAASVIMSLLLLSGDIEENPGPGSQGIIQENYIHLIFSSIVTL